MKIALIDNSNNNFFAITRYFRDLNIDAHLYLIPNSGLPQFEPQSDTFNDLRKVDWIRDFPFDCSWRGVFKSKKKLYHQFKDYDHIIACGLSVGLLNSVGIKISMFIPYGADLFNFPFIRIPTLSEPIKFIPRIIMNMYRRYYQVDGIRSSKIIISNSNWVMAERAIKELGVKSTNLPRLMIYQDNNKNYDNYWSFMDAYDFTIFSHTRHLWKTNSDPSEDFFENGGMKRNDKLIKAFSIIVNKAYFKKPCLILFDYGTDVDHSKSLIKSLNIQEYVRWEPMMYRKNILIGMKKATFVADQFRKHMSATSAGSTNEALSVGVPIISNTDGAIYDKDDPFYGAPILDCLEIDQIVGIIDDYYNDKDKYIEIGLEGKKWFDNNLGYGLAKKYLELLN